MENKKVIYIAGPVAGVDKYWEAFEQAEEDLAGLGYIPLSPAHLPQGMTNAQYMRIDLAMVGAAAAVLFLPNWDRSEGARLEAQYCHYIDKPMIEYKTRNGFTGEALPREVTQAWLKADLEKELTR